MVPQMAPMVPQISYYCYLRKTDWIVEGHDKGDARTIENMIEQVEKNLQGAARRGMKFRPYWDFIPVANYCVPLLYLLIGVFNDIDEYVLDVIDSIIITLSEGEQTLREQYKHIDI